MIKDGIKIMPAPLAASLALGGSIKADNKASFRLISSADDPIAPGLSDY